MTFSNVAGGTGRQSDRLDKGAGATPAWWEMRCWVSLTGANAVGSLLEYYIGTGDGTHPDAGLATTTTTITSDQRYALTLVGILRVYQTLTDVTMTTSFRNVFLPGRYIYIAFWNGTGLPTTTSTTAHRCTLTAMTPEMTP